MPLKAEGYRPDIDGLRAFSIVAVVLYHLRLPWFAAGYLGVDIFFVISGFLITGMLIHEVEGTGTIELARFYARRMRRLLPAFCAMGLGTAALALLLLTPVGEQRLFGNALSRSALFVYNISVWRGSYDYAAMDAQQQVLMHTWSLGVEEQFYLTWPWICLIAVRSGRPGLMFFGATIVSLSGAWWTLPSDLAAVFFLLPFRTWELGLGAWVAMWPRKMSPDFARWGAAGGATLVGLAFLSRQGPGASVWPQLLATAGTALMIGLGSPASLVSSILGIRPLVFLGQISYPWYLWHWPLLVIGRLTTIGDQASLDGGAAAASLALAILTHFTLERPARRVDVNRPVRVLALGAAAISVLVGIGLSIEAHSRRLMAQPENAARLLRFNGEVLDNCQPRDLIGCRVSARSAHGDAALLLWGDSFARALSPALNEYSGRSGVRAYLLFDPSCPPLLGVVPASRPSRSEPNARCLDLLRRAEARLRERPVGVQGVILAARWPGYVPGSHGGSVPMFRWDGAPIEGIAAISDGLASTLELLESMKLRVLVVGAPPQFPFDVLACLWRSPMSCAVDRSWDAAARESSRDAVKSVVRGRNSVRFVDLFDPLCAGPRCKAGTLDEPLLRDRGHLSDFAARRMVLPIMEPQIDWLLDRTSAASRPEGP